MGYLSGSMVGESRIALIAARTKVPTPTTLSSEKARLVAASDAPGDPVPANGDVSGVLDALKSVVPTAIAGVYSAAVVVLFHLAQTQGASDRTDLQTKLAAAGEKPDAIKKVLDALPDESKHLVGLRWLIVAVAIAAVVVVTLGAARDAMTRTNNTWRFPLAELVVAEVAFIGWALAMPGTPLGAYHAASNLTALTVTTTACAGLVVASFGKLVLTKPQK